MNNGIVNLTITVTLQDTGAQQPLTPLFNILADDGPTRPGEQRFSCDGLGDNNQDLLKDILRKINTSYPTKPISLCLSGSEIVADAQCADGRSNMVVNATFDIASTSPPLIRFVVEFSKPMPNGSGTMEATIKDQLYKFPLKMYHGPTHVPVGPGKNATRFLVVYDPTKIPVTKEEFPAALATRPVKVDLDF